MLETFLFQRLYQMEVTQLSRGNSERTVNSVGRSKIFENLAGVEIRLRADEERVEIQRE